MKLIVKMIATAGVLAGIASCADNAEQASNEEKDFKYIVDEFADLKVIRYRIDAFENLSLDQQKYVYYLCEAAKWGRDIFFDQNCKENIPIRKAIEKIIECYDGDRECEEFAGFMVYAKRFFFSNGMHHHYAQDKFFPECSREYFQSLMFESNVRDSDRLLEIIYNPDIYPQRKSTSQTGDIVALSAVNFYEGVSREEAESYYASKADSSSSRPISLGLNSKLYKDADGNICEEVWNIKGKYGPAIKKICKYLRLAARYAENDEQKAYISDLISYYKTGDLKTWDEYNIKWLQAKSGVVDFINGYIEDYNDPLARKGSWEAHVNIKDEEASQRTATISDNAQWFEDNSPVDPRFKKKVVKGVSAKVIDAMTLAGDCYPSTPIGINLPNSDWIRRDYGSKSVTIANITDAYSKAAQESPRSVLREFAWDEAEVQLCKKYGNIVDNLHTDLHECLGHGSGQLLEGTSPNALGEFSATLEEARADLFGLYYLADPKMIELGLVPDAEAYKAQYSSYIRNGIMTQFTRVEPGKTNTEAHMQNRQIIAQWCYEKGLKDNVIEKRVRDGKTYFVVNDYEALRGLFGVLLAEVQRIKSEGDYAAGKALVENYGVNIDPVLHKEVIERYAALGLKPYSGFVNPDIIPIRKGRTIVGFEVSYDADFISQSMKYGKFYSVLFKNK